MSDWASSAIEEIAERVAMGPFGSSIKVSTFVPDGVPVISGQHLHESRLTDLNFNFVSEEHASRLAKANVQRGDVILTHAGTIGQVAVIPVTSKYDRYVISQRQFYIRCDRSKMIPEFLTYYLRSPEGQHKVLANANQTGVPSIAQPVSYIRTVVVPVPSLAEQQAIAGVLGALDDKIESNRRLSHTGVQLARTMLLEGDTRVRLGNVAKCEKGLSYKGDSLVEGSDSGLPMINLGNFTTTGWLVPDKLKFYRGEYKERHLVQPGDVVVANTDLTQQRVIIGRPALVPPALRKAIFTHHVTAVRPFSDAKLRLPIWAQLNSGAFRERAEGFATGTTVAGMPVEALLDFEIELPNDSLVNEAQTLLERVWIAEAETSDLTRIRDVLLPALLSGALRVPDADKIVEEAV